MNGESGRVDYIVGFGAEVQRASIAVGLPYLFEKTTNEEWRCDYQVTIGESVVVHTMYGGNCFQALNLAVQLAHWEELQIMTRHHNTIRFAGSPDDDLMNEKMLGDWTEFALSQIRRYIEHSREIIAILERKIGDVADDVDIL